MKIINLIEMSSLNYNNGEWFDNYLKECSFEDFIFYRESFLYKEFGRNKNRYYHNLHIDKIINIINKRDKYEEPLNNWYYNNCVDCIRSDVFDWG